MRVDDISRELDAGGDMAGDWTVAILAAAYVDDLLTDVARAVVNQFRGKADTEVAA